MSETRNIPASVAERLKNIARQSGKAFDALILLYFQERFLHRLSISGFHDRFVLKGGLFLYSQSGFKSRPTKDIDFLAKQIANDLERLRDSFVSVCSIEVPEDGVVFQVDGMTTERIKEDADYEGVRVKVIVTLGRIRKTLQFDIGFGDIVVPKPQWIAYPVLLRMEPPRVLAYSKESVIAEKFEAMISLSVMNSRMKDFYDIFTLMSEEYDGRVLYEAIFETFQHRGTIIERDHPLFSESFARDEGRIRQWHAFLKRIGDLDFADFETVMDGISTFLEPVYHCVLREREFFGKWVNEERKWRQ